MKRRVLCLILAVIMVACLLPTAAFASTNGKTADDAINWVRSLEGQPVGSGECVALIKAYYSYLGQTSPGGNGADYSWNQLPRWLAQTTKRTAAEGRHSGLQRQW